MLNELLILTQLEKGLFTSKPLSVLFKLGRRFEHGPQNTASNFRLYRSQGYLTSKKHIYDYYHENVYMVAHMVVYMMISNDQTNGPIRLR